MGLRGTGAYDGAYGDRMFRRGFKPQKLLMRLHGSGAFVGVSGLGVSVTLANRFTKISKDSGIGQCFITATCCETCSLW